MSSQPATGQVIRTPDQRLRVFVSSTLVELAAERHAARDAITHLHLFPVMFEIGASAHPPRDLYRAYIEQSHVFVGIYWQRYGWIPPGAEISGLEEELLLAEGRPRLLYVREPSPEIDPRLSGLLDRIRSEGSASYKLFATANELREIIENDLAVLLSERFEMTTPGTVHLPRTSVDEASRLTSLPRLLGPLIGRESEVAAAREALLDNEVTLLTLTGPGGTGKTRLALHVAAELADRFEDGACFVPLAPVSDPALVPSAIAQALDVREAGDRSLGELVLLHLREQALLLVLDNFEHVVDAGLYVSALRDSCPRLKILVTSRAVLRLVGERELPIPPLALPAPHADELAAVAESAAVELFVRRSRDVRPDFTLTADNAAAVGEICSRLDGLPLAIELAAARSKIFDPPGLLARLDRRLPLLTTGPRDLPARQRTLRDAIGWSYDLLTDEEQALFRRVCVFVGGCTLEAVEAVCNESCGIDVLDGLASLVDKSLLRRSGGVGGEPRFLVLETIREYGHECLEELSELESARQSHAESFLSLAEEADRSLKGGGEALWLDRLELEHDNLRAALGWAVERQEAELGLRLGGALGRFWVVHGHLQEGRQRLESVLALTDAEARTSSRASALTALGVLARTQGDYSYARRQLEESRDIANELGSPAALASALNNLGNVHLLEEDYGRAEALLGESLALWRQVGSRPGMGASLNNLGLVAIVRGELERARSLYEEVLEINRELGSTRGEALALGNLALVALHGQDYSRAGPLLGECLVLFQGLRDTDNIVAVLMGLAGVAASEGRLERAARLCGAAEALRESIGAPLSLLDREPYERAVEALESGLEPATLETAWAAGRSMSLDDAAAYALGPD